VADRELFESEALPWIDAVYRAALAMCGDPAAADDLLQATYLKAWTRFEQFQPGSNCRAWLMQIARNTWFDQLRRRQPVGLERAEALDQFPADPVAPPPASGDLAGYLEQMDDERLVAALLRLPEPFRVALFLVDVEEHSQKEAAEMLGVAVGTVKSRTSRARRMLREALAEEASERSATGEDSHG
jgi:RNA polymerase sigma-70 factor (ECF subfamily)